MDRAFGSNLQKRYQINSLRRLVLKRVIWHIFLGDLSQSENFYKIKSPLLLGMHCASSGCNALLLVSLQQCKNIFCSVCVKKQTSAQFLTIKILSCNQNKLVNLFFEAKEIDFISHFRLLFFERCKHYDKKFTK